MAKVISDKRLYLNKKGWVVTDDDPTQAYLLVCEGGEIEESRLAELGMAYVDGHVVVGDGRPMPAAKEENPTLEYDRPIWPTTIGRIIKKIFKIK